MQAHATIFDEAARTSLPRRFGRYALAHKLGAGGFATVYLARPLPGDHFVAIKRMHAHYADEPEFVNMFVDEARIARSVVHPNVCAILDVGEVNGEVYLAMEHLIGEPLSCVGRTLADRDAHIGVHERLVLIATIVARAADGLHAAHEAIGSDGAALGIVHRDVAPQNVFVCYDGTVRVVDFGCATAAGRLFHTEDGTARGHVDFVSPEQLRGERVDRRADVWSIGVLLWQLATGRLLFRRGSQLATMFAIAREDVAPPREVDARIPLRFDSIVMGALQRNRSTRIATADELSRRLKDFVAATSVPMETDDVARWMEALLPGGRVAQEVMLERAREVLEAHLDGSATREFGTPGPAGAVRSWTPESGESPGSE